MKKYIKILASNLLLAVTAVVLYSPGILALRVSDESILRAGMSVLAGLALVCIFFYMNDRFLREPSQKPVLMEEVSDFEKAKAILKEYRNGEYFGSTARTAISQLDRILKCRQKLSVILAERFTVGTMSWDKFNNIIQAAENASLQNVVSMANRMRLFDEKEYARLQYYKEDDIPDDIQEEQIKLYQKNLEAVKAAITLNEKILYKLDSLALELSVSKAEETMQQNEELLTEIERLTQETKYYQ